MPGAPLTLDLLHTYRQIGKIQGSCAAISVPRTVPTLCVSGPFHCGPRVVLLRVDVAPRDRHIAVPGQVRERPRVHVGRPPRQARMAKGVQRELI
jgi:hypothetical protein